MPRRIGAGGPFIVPELLDAQSVDISTVRAPLFNQSQPKKQLGSVDFIPNLLLTTLAVVVTSLPAGKQLFDSQAQAERVNAPDSYPNLSVTTLAPVVQVIPPGDQGFDSAPSVRRNYFADVQRTPLTLGINPNPQVKTLDSSAPLRKRQVQVDQYPNLSTSTFSDTTVYQPGIPADFCARQTKYQVQLDTPTRPLTLFAVVVTAPFVPKDFAQVQRKVEVRAEQAPWPVTLGIPAPPAPRAWQLDSSAPSVKYRPQVDTYPNLGVTVFTTPPVFPVGEQVSDSAPPLKSAVYAQQQHNTLAQGINPNPRAWQWSDSAPAIKYQLRVEYYQNLSSTTLVPSTTQPPGKQWFESAPPRKVAVYAEPPRNILAAGINPNPGVQRLDASAPRVKYRPQVDVYPDLLLSTLQQFQPAPVRDLFKVPYEIRTFRVRVEKTVYVARETGCFEVEIEKLTRVDNG